MSPRLRVSASAFFALLHLSAFAALPAPYAHYRTEGLKTDGASVTAWADSATPARSLARSSGSPKTRVVSTPSGDKPVVRLDGSSALWQTAGSWGTLKSERTVVVFARLSDKGDGFLFDGSTKTGSAPAQIVAGQWKTASTATPVPTSGSWQVLSFVFPKDSPALGGFILGANVAASSGLACDIAETLVYDQALTTEQLAEVSSKLTSAWGTPADLPEDKQPKSPTFTDDPRVFRTTIRKQRDEGVDTYRIPGLATTTKGTLIAVFDIRHANGADLPGDIDVGMMRSTDNGETWSPMKAIMDYDKSVPGSGGNGVGDPTILVDQRTGRIIVAALHSFGKRAWFGSGPGMDEKETGQFVINHSDDDGLTWSKPVSINTQIKDPLWHLVFNGPGSGIQLRDGTLVFPAQFKDAAKQPHSCFIASTDGGNTWKISPAAIPGKPPTSEAQIVELSDGSLLLSMRDESRSGKRAWAKWSWKGNVMKGEWSPHWLDVTDPTCMASVILHPSGKLVFSNPNSATRRVAMTIRTSSDDGKTWSSGKLLDPSGAMYSSLTVLKDGRLGLLYESGDAAGLVFARFPLEWALETSASSKPSGNPAVVPVNRPDRSWWMPRHEEKKALSKAGNVDIAFLGDSITQGWETFGKGVWENRYAKRRAANYGFSGDATQHVLWRLDNGELDGIKPKVVVLMIGTNNTGKAAPGSSSAAQTTEGVKAVLDRLAERLPDSKVLLLAVFPHGDKPDTPTRLRNDEVNRLLPALADGKRVHFHDINKAFLDASGVLSREVMPDLLHPREKGYQLWADAMEPKLRELLGE